MKKLGLFVLNFSLFFGLASIMLLGAVSAIYFALCFVAWSMLGVDQLSENAPVVVRIAMVFAFALATGWIFTDGRREWDR
jgi:hypothetical protein